MMKRNFKVSAWIILIIIVFIANPAHAGESRFKIEYVSAEHIYIDGGAVDKITTGDTLTVFREGTLIGTIVADYVSNHSTSCKIITSDVSLQSGDLVKFSIKDENVEVIEPDTVLVMEPILETKSKVSKQKILATNEIKFKGRASFQYYQVNDNNSSNLDFQQPTFRFDLRVLNLGGDGYSLKIKTRTRHNNRAKSYNSSVSESEWRNRLYEISYGRDIEDRNYGFRVGRIIANEISGIGYIDGLLLNRKLFENTKFGVFAGAQPEWQYADFQSSLQKYGAYFNMKKGDYKSFRWQSTLAFAAEYHSATISREFLYLQNRISNGGKWRIYQSLNLDFNRDWKKEKAGESITFSNLFLTGRYKFTSWLNAGLRYDNRKNYWTYDNMNRDESLFDYRYRRGVRFNLTLSLPNKYSIMSNIGIRSIEDNSELSNYYYVGFRKSNFTPLNVSYNINYSGFSNEFTDGQRLSLRLSKYFRKGHNISMKYGEYSYEYLSSGNDRKSSWTEFGTFVRLSRHIYFSGNFTVNSGDDINGNHSLTELGYRF